MAGGKEPNSPLTPHHLQPGQLLSWDIRDRNRPTLREPVTLTRRDTARPRVVFMAMAQLNTRHEFDMRNEKCMLANK